jgi:inner membrane protein
MIESIEKPKSYSIGLKVVLIGFLIVALLIPALLILGIVSERESMRDIATKDVSSMWGGQQQIGAVLLSIPYREVIESKDKKTISKTRHIHILPRDLSINTVLKPVIRKRGIYDVILYEASIEMQGKFSNFELANWGIDEENVLWSQVFVTVGVGDSRGITEKIELRWDGQAIEMQPGTKCAKIIPAGANAGILDFRNQQGNEVPFHINMNIRGNGELDFLPVGKSTNIHIKSPWPTPSFGGSFLPTERTIDADGFSAHWQVSEFNRNYPQQWTGTGEMINTVFCGVELIRPVDVYVKTERAVKYAVLFIGLTFMAFFMVEIMKGARFHTMHYLLVGFAVTLFYLLLLSTSEHMDFAWSYLLSSLGVISVTGIYVRGVTNRWSMTVILVSVMTALYVFLFILLQLEELALLIGSTVLFLILSSVMILTRKIDWYTIGAGKQKKTKVPVENNPTKL